MGFSPLVGEDSDDEVVTEQLTAVVDVSFFPHNNPEISQEFERSRDTLIKNIVSNV